MQMPKSFSVPASVMPSSVSASSGTSEHLSCAALAMSSGRSTFGACWGCCIGASEVADGCAPASWAAFCAGASPAPATRSRAATAANAAGDSGQCGIDRGAPGQFDSLPSSLVTATSSEACADHLTAPSAQEIDLVEVVVPVVRSRSPRCGTAGAVPGLTGSAVGRRGLLGLLVRLFFLRYRLFKVDLYLILLLYVQRHDGTPQ